MPSRDWFKRWEMLMAVILIAVVIINLQLSSNFLNSGNLINLFKLSIEKIIVALIMTFIIINGEIDLSVASMMGLSSCIFASIYEKNGSLLLAIIAPLIVGILCGAFNGFWIAYVELPSLAVTLAGLIGYRGFARILLEDRSIGNFPKWFNDLGQQGLVGKVPFALILFFVLLIIAGVILHYSAYGRYVFIIGNNREAARFSGVQVRRVKLSLFIMSSLIASLAGLLYTARLGTVRANIAEGFELDIITMVLLGGVSIFGGTGSMVGVALSVMVVLNIRNGMGLAGLTGNLQTSAIGALLILSVLIPNLARDLQQFLVRHPLRSLQVKEKEEVHPTT